MNTLGKQVKMTDIAQLAGVSIATVSRAIHEPEKLRKETLSRVLQTIAKFDYVYNTSAADFKKRRASLIGLIVPTIRSSIQAELIHGIQQRLADTSCSLIIANTDYNLDAERRYLEQFGRRQLSGLILVGIRDELRTSINDLVSRGTPVVITWELIRDAGIANVGFDNYRAAKAGTEHLLALGHTRIGVIVGPQRAVAKRIQERIRGHNEALKKVGLRLDPGLLIETLPNPNEGLIAARNLLALPERPTAIFAMGDALAIGALTAANEAGLHVPRDLSVLGFDDIEFSTVSYPALSTVHVPAFEMGEKAVDIILAALAGADSPPQHLRLGASLIVRGSTGPLRTSPHHSRTFPY